MLFVPPSIPYMVPEAAAELTIVPWGQTDYGSQWSYRDYQPYGVAPCENPVFAGLTCPATLQDSWLHQYPVLQDMTLNITNTTGIPRLYFHEPRVSDNGEDVDSTSCNVPHTNGNAYQVMPVGTTGITCTYGSLTATYTITVVYTDTTPPVVALVCCGMSGDTTENITRQATNSTGYNVGFAVSGTDNVQTAGTPAVPVYCSAPNVTPNVTAWQDYGLHNSLFPVGVTTVTCTATDVAGNTTIETFTVTITLEGADAVAEEEIVIPAWIKNNAGWWDAGLIDDRNYVTGLQWLISNGVMTIPSTAQGTGSGDVIPSWIKNNAGWWADGSIDDRNYVTGLQWLITNGVMIIG